MPSPFPGMDPYIETPRLWSDFHSDLAGEIRAALNAHILPRYFAGLTEHVTYETIEVARPYGIKPDVAVWQTQPEAEAPTAAALAITPAPALSAVELEMPLSLYTVEVHLAETDELVAVIELLSPVNKQRTHKAHRDYQRKRRDLLRSSTHFMEIDLLRGGERSPLQEPVPPAPYYVTLSRATHRPVVEVWPIQLNQTLPVLPVPLLEPDPDAPLDLGALVKEVYRRGAYQARINYQNPPPPPELTEAEKQWVENLLRKAGN